MRCRACNDILTPAEDARKFKESGTRVELCDKDFEPIRGMVAVVERKDLDKGEAIGDESYYD